MKILNGKELAGFIKSRQAKQVKNLRQSFGVVPKLAIIVLKDDPVINLYVNLKQQYGKDIGVFVEVYRILQREALDLISKLNNDNQVHGIIIQLPIEDKLQTDEILNMVASNKDVDALGVKAKYDPATPTAILWLLAGYNIELKGKKILIIGKGKLVGAPLTKILKKSNHQVTMLDRSSKDLPGHTKQADIIITATGSPAILFSDMIKQKAIVVDAGVASEDGKLVGDLADDVYRRDDLVLTPKKGGVGPLTVCALFENIIIAAKSAAKMRDA